MSKKPSKEEIRESLASSPIEPLFAEKANFLAWLGRNVPKKYRQATETPNCFSANRDFYPILGIGFPEKRNSLALANIEAVKRLQHALGNDSAPCERCIREINAAAVYQIRHHPEIFTPATHKLIDLEYQRRRLEHRIEDQGYKSDGLYLLQVKVPLMGGDSSLHETHLVFYDERSLRHGKHTFIDRIEKNPELLPKLACFAQFGDIQQYRFPRIKHSYSSISSEEHIQRAKGHMRTVVEIVSRKTG